MIRLLFGQGWGKLGHFFTASGYTGSMFNVAKVYHCEAARSLQLCDKLFYKAIKTFDTDPRPTRLSGRYCNLLATIME